MNYSVCLPFCNKGECYRNFIVDNKFFNKTQKLTTQKISNIAKKLMDLEFQYAQGDKKKI